MKWNNIGVALRLSVYMMTLLIAMLGMVGMMQYHVIGSASQALVLVQDYDRRIVTAVDWLGVAGLTGERMLVALRMADANLAGQYEQDVQIDLTRMQVMQKNMSMQPQGEDDRGILTEIEKIGDRLVAVFTKADSYKSDVNSMQAVIDSELEPTIVMYLDALLRFVKLQEQQRDHFLQKVKEQGQQWVYFSLAGAVLLVVVGILMVFMIARSVTRPLIHAVTFAEKITLGDLTERVIDTRRDEFGQLLQALHRISMRLHTIVSNVRDGMESVLSVFGEIASSHHVLAVGSEQITAKLQCLAVGMGEFTDMAAQSMHSARQVRDFVMRVTCEAEHGSKVVDGVLGDMTQLAQLSQKIVDVVDVVEDIAFQTNILVVNAAVEAARVSEQRSGFVVVAGEIGNLAQRLVQAIEEIRTLVDASLTVIDTGSDQACDVRRVMSGIVGGGRHVLPLVEEMTTTSGRQGDDVRQANHAIVDLDGVVQQNAALVTQVATTAQSLRDQVVDLRQLVSVFNLTDGPSLTSAVMCDAQIPASISLG